MTLQPRSLRERSHLMQLMLHSMRALRPQAFMRRRRIDQKSQLTLHLLEDLARIRTGADIETETTTIMQKAE